LLLLPLDYLRRSLPLLPKDLSGRLPINLWLRLLPWLPDTHLRLRTHLWLRLGSLPTAAALCLRLGLWLRPHLRLRHPLLSRRSSRWRASAAIAASSMPFTLRKNAACPRQAKQAQQDSRRKRCKILRSHNLPLIEQLFLLADISAISIPELSY
jgi:hypothetical protein